jgi:DNA-directed RNA polymerase subunit RPC12/RpoP
VLALIDWVMDGLWIDGWVLLSSGTNQPLAAYFCNICRLFDDDSEKDIYHCPYCNVCRIGEPVMRPSPKAARF